MSKNRQDLDWGREGIPCTGNGTGKDMEARCAENTHSDESSYSRGSKVHVLEQ